MRQKVTLSFIGILGLLILLFFLVWQPVRAIPNNCIQTYTVQPGDNLSRIAAETGTTIYHLGDLNQIANLNLIFAGTVLCVRTDDEGTAGSGDMTIGAERKSRSLDLVTIYQLSADTDLGSRIGDRQSYTIPSPDNIFIYTNTQKLLSETTQRHDPLLWLVQSEDDTYTLVAFPDFSFANTFTNTDNTIKNAFDPYGAESAEKQALVTSEIANRLADVQSLALQAELKSESTSESILIDITGIDYLHPTTVSIEGQAFTEFDFATVFYGNERIALALHPRTTSGNYDLLILMEGDTSIGPPGGGWPSRCSSWSTGGWWNQFRYSWFGC